MTQITVPYDPDFDSSSTSAAFWSLDKRLIFYTGLALGLGLTSLIVGALLFFTL